MRERGGRVRATVIEATDAATLVGMVEASVVPGTTVYTDEASAYGPLKRRYNHDSVKHSISEYVRGDVHTKSGTSVAQGKRILLRHLNRRNSYAYRSQIRRSNTCSLPCEQWSIP